MKNSSNFELDSFTIIACLIIIAAFIASFIYIKKASKNELQQHKKWISQLPSLISTLGVFGTFLGITKGLIGFDTQNLNIGIPLLLNGLKTAFFTSLTGMLGALILNRMVSKKFDTYDNVSDAEKAAKLIIDALKSNNVTLYTKLDTLSNSLINNKVFEKMSVDIEQMKDDVEEIKGYFQETQDRIDVIIGNIEKTNNKIENLGNNQMNNNEELSRIRAVLLTATSSISTIDNSIDDINKSISKIEGETVSDNRD